MHTQILKRNVGQAGNLDDTSDKVQTTGDQDVHRPLFRGFKPPYNVYGMLNRRQDVDILFRECRYKR